MQIKLNLRRLRNSQFSETTLNNIMIEEVDSVVETVRSEVDLELETLTQDDVSV